MKNLLNKNISHVPDYIIVNHKRNHEAKIIDFKPDHHNHFILRIKIDNIKKDNYNLVLQDEHLSVILFKSIELNKPLHLHNFNLNNVSDYLNYDEQENFDFTLPGKDFYLINHKVNPLSQTLQVMFGKIHHN